jgi:hypothetical protein
MRPSGDDDQHDGAGDHDEHYRTRDDHEHDPAGLAQRCLPRVSGSEARRITVRASLPPERATVSARS